MEEAYRWYEGQRNGLGEAFLAAVQLALDAAAANPRAYSQVHRDKRRVLLGRFPYGLVYRIIEEQLVVIACLHAKRNPRLLRTRT